MALARAGSTQYRNHGCTLIGEHIEVVSQRTEMPHELPPKGRFCFFL